MMGFVSKSIFSCGRGASHGTNICIRGLEKIYMFLFVSIIYIIKLFINKLDLNMKWFALAAVCCWTSAHAFVPSAGTWVVNDELNGKPGRGLAIDVQNHVLVMQMYAYEKNDQPTF